MPGIEQPVSRKNETLVKLSSLADEFVFNDEVQLNLQDVLQECVDTYQNYQDEVKKIKNMDHTESEKVSELCKSAYIYYKIVHNFITKVIPHLPEFEVATGPKASKLQAELIKIYYSLFSRLESDKKISYIKNIIIKHMDTQENNHSVESHEQVKLSNKKLPVNRDAIEIDKDSILQDIRYINGKRSGSGISCSELLSLMKMKEDSLLLIDVRPKLEYDAHHIKTKNIICIEPISFKESYSDQQIEKTSMIPSPKHEIQLFQRRSEFQYIILYTDLEEKSNFYFQQLKSLLEIILQRSFLRPIDDRKTKVLFLSDSLQNWIKNGGEIDKSQEVSKIRNRSISGSGPLLNSLSERKTIGAFPDINRNSTKQMPISPLPSLPGSERTVATPPNGSSTLGRINSPVTHYPKAPLINDSEFHLNINNNHSPPTHLPTKDNNPLASSMPIGSDHKPFMSPQNSLPLAPKPPTLESKNYNFISDRSNIIDQKQNRSRSLEPQLPPIPSTLIRKNSPEKTLSCNQMMDTSFTVGLENMGNSCYINCIIQCIFATTELIKIFLNGTYAKHINKQSKLGSKGVLSHNFAKLLKDMYEENSSKKIGKKHGAVKTLQFKMACASVNSLFKDASQQDCLEFCQFLLDGLHEDLNQCGANPPLKELSPEAEKMRENLSLRVASSIEWERYLTTDFSIIVDLFQGQYASQLRCKVCNRTSTTYQAFSVLSVPVPSGKSCGLLDCFIEFTKTENLEVDEQWFCPSCKKKQPSTKKLTITRLPRNLIIHLKRFDNMMNKNNIFVRYPQILDLTPFWANDSDGKLPPGITDEIPARGQVPPFNYRLYGAACHFGTLYGGHYTSYVDKGPEKGWIYFDDTVYRPVRFQNEFISPSAYVLFYHRITS